MNRWRSAARSLVRTTTELIYPQLCVMCGAERPDGRICALCRELLPRNVTACERCAVPLETSLPQGVHCADCQKKPPAFEFARAPFVYAFPVDCALKALKFDRHLHYVPAFADYLVPELRLLEGRVDALLPVPLHRWRYVRRGFNQAIELCKPLHRATGLPVNFEVERVKATQMQSGLSASERRRNLKDAFAVSAKLGCRRPLIVDDVMTTGATCRRLAEVLLQNGAERVGVLVVARSTIRR